MIRIILAEDHQVVREALRMLLETQPDLKVIAEAGDGLEALRLVERDRPDILILDLMLPALPGLEIARRVKAMPRAPKMIMLSMYDSQSYVVEAIQAGAAAYVLKKSSAQDLITAIRRVLAGDLYLSPALDEQQIEAHARQSRENSGSDPLARLTPREREILYLVAEGLSSPQIAERFSLSVRTVEMHRGNLMKKLRLKSQTELVKFAVKRGLI